MTTKTFYLPSHLRYSTSSADFAGISLEQATVSPEELATLARSLNDAASRLRTVSLGVIVAAIDAVAARWSDPLYPPRQALAPLLAATTGTSLAMVDHVLTRMCADWRSEALWERLNSEFGDPLVLDSWRPWGKGQSRVFGPRLIWHICAGNVLGVGLQSLVDGLLVKAPAIVKPARDEPLLAAAWAAELSSELPILSEALAVLWWPGGNHILEAALFPHLEAAIVNGSNTAIADLRQRLPSHIRFLDYGARLSFALVAKEALGNLGALAEALAYDIAVFDQAGCVSPHLLVVESTHTQALAEAIDRALASQEQTLPRGPLTSTQAQAIRQRRDDAEWRELAGEAITMYGQNHAWTVIDDPMAQFGPGCGGRTIVIRAMDDIAALPELLAPWRDYLQSVALAATPERAPMLAAWLGELGISRITPPGRQGWPATTWHHDGRQPLAALVRWSDWEAPDVL